MTTDAFNSASGPEADAGFDQRLRCLQCDYMLKGLPSNRCPECGTVIDWEAARAAASHKGLPLDLATGWGRISAGLATWLMVLFRPLRFAGDLSERSSCWPAVAFAAVCLTVGVAANRLWGTDDGPVISWVVGCWFHIECQSLLFFVVDFRSYRRRQHWDFWRKVSLYTTAFVPLDWFAGPPVLEDYWSGNFPWLLDRETWSLGGGWPADLDSIARGVAYYWWMIVLSLTLWRRLRRKWTLVIILLLMPWVTMASCRVGYHAGELAGDLGFSF